MKTIVIVIFCIMLCTSPFGVFHLLTNYGFEWKYKDLKPFGKFIYIYLWGYLLGVVFVWVMFVTYMLNIACN